jgi:hypothetical protein
VHHSVAAFSGFNVNFYLVCEHTLTQFLLNKGCVYQDYNGKHFFKRQPGMRL